MVDTDQVRGMMVVAEADFGAVREWEISAKKEGTHWNALLKITYDVLHFYAEALLLCDCVKAKNHECLYAYLCENYPHLELSWEFFQSLRTMRNRSMYYGRPATYEDWNIVHIPLFIYITTIKKEVEKRLSST